MSNRKTKATEKKTNQNTTTVWAFCILLLDHSFPAAVFNSNSCQSLSHQTGSCYVHQHMIFDSPNTTMGRTIGLRKRPKKKARFLYSSWHIHYSVSPLGGATNTNASQIQHPHGMIELQPDPVLVAFQ